MWRFVVMLDPGIKYGTRSSSSLPSDVNLREDHVTIVLLIGQSVIKSLYLHYVLFYNDIDVIQCMDGEKLATGHCSVIVLNHLNVVKILQI